MEYVNCGIKLQNSKGWWLSDQNDDSFDDKYLE